MRIPVVIALLVLLGATHAIAQSGAVGVGVTIRPASQAGVARVHEVPAGAGESSPAEEGLRPVRMDFPVRPGWMWALSVDVEGDGITAGPADFTVREPGESALAAAEARAGKTSRREGRLVVEIAPADFGGARRSMTVTYVIAPL